MRPNQDRDPTMPGRVDIPAMLYGAVGVIVAVALFLVGLLGKGDQRIFNQLYQPVFLGETPDILSTPVLIILTMVFCFGLAFAVLDSPGAWRRVLLGLTVLLLIAAMVPTLAVWKIYFPPMMTLVGVFWTWFCSMMYVNHHQMPCDVPYNQRPIVSSDVVAPVKQMKENEPATKKSKKRKATSEGDKYKPKDLLDG